MTHANLFDLTTNLMNFKYMPSILYPISFIHRTYVLVSGLIDGACIEDDDELSSLLQALSIEADDIS